MKKIVKIVILAVVCVLIVEWATILLSREDFVVFQTKGMIAQKERNLILVSIILMCIVVIPAIVMTLFFAWKYREGNQRAKYTPDWKHSHLAEAIWWGVPFAIIVVLSVITWQSSHELDPFKPIDHEEKPLTIQVVALRWKWLFIYPEQGIATVNYIQFPKDKPLAFEITADAPMNSFWIPQLGGQIYAMSGMKTKLHLIANEEGTFRGSSANLSGKGFSGMIFSAISTSEDAFARWVGQAQGSAEELTQETYDLLAKPSEYNQPATYVLKDEDLFERIVRKPMAEMR